MAPVNLPATPTALSDKGAAEESLASKDRSPKSQGKRARKQKENEERGFDLEALEPSNSVQSAPVQAVVELESSNSTNTTSVADHKLTEDEIKMRELDKAEAEMDARGRAKKEVKLQKKEEKREEKEAKRDEKAVQ